MSQPVKHPHLTPDYLATLVSVASIVKANGHSRIAVHRALTRLAINPILSHPYRLYDPAVIADLKKKMRKPSPRNREARP
jgi:hypothetical protein